MYTVRDIAIALARDASGATVFNMIQDAIFSADLSFKLTTLERELLAVPEYQAYKQEHDKLVDKCGRKPDKDDPPEVRRSLAVVDGKCTPENIADYNKGESELLNREVDRDIKKVPNALFTGQKVRGSWLERIYPFIDFVEKTS